MTYGAPPERPGRELLAKYGIDYSPVHGWVGPGWWPILDQLFAVLVLHGWDRKVTQIKEKFGGLRVHLNSYDANAWTAIRVAEAHAWDTCEMCGTTQSVRTRGDSWLRTRCNACYIAEIDSRDRDIQDSAIRRQHYREVRALRVEIETLRAAREVGIAESKEVLLVVNSTTDVREKKQEVSSCKT